MKTTVKFGVAAVFLVVAGPLAAQQDSGTPMLDRGTREFAVAGRIDLPGFDEIDYELDGSFGYFFRDGWEAGIQASASDLNGRDRIELSGFTDVFETDDAIEDSLSSIKIGMRYYF